MAPRNTLQDRIAAFQARTGGSGSGGRTQSTGNALGENIRRFFINRNAKQSQTIQWDEEKQLAYIEKDGQKQYIFRQDGQPYSRGEAPTTADQSFLATEAEIQRGKTAAGWEIPRLTTTDAPSADPYLSPSQKNPNNLIDPDAGALPDSLAPQAETETMIQREGGKENPFGEEVFQLQEELTKKGFHIGDDGVDGYYGPNTEEAVRQFQKQNGLEPSGVVDSKTWKLLMSRQR